MSAHTGLFTTFSELNIITMMRNIFRCTQCQAIPFQNSRSVFGINIKNIGAGSIQLDCGNSS